MAGPGDKDKVTPAAPTVEVGNGPYYVSSTAELPDGNLNFTGLPGDQVGISGRVFGGPGGATPLPRAKIEIWHADAQGSYHPNAAGDAPHFHRDDLALRGYVLSDEDGHYEFRSIYPGKYPGRCRHYHTRVSAAGHTPVSTQLIFPALPGDDRRPDNDFVARSLPPDYQLALDTKGGTQEAVFDFRLAVE